MRRPQVRASAWLLAAAAGAGIVVIVLAALFDGAATRTERSQQALAARLEALGDAQHQVEKLLLDVEPGSAATC